MRVFSDRAAFRVKARPRLSYTLHIHAVYIYILVTCILTRVTVCVYLSVHPTSLSFSLTYMCAYICNRDRRAAPKSPSTHFLASILCCVLYSVCCAINIVLLDKHSISFKSGVNVKFFFLPRRATTTTSTTITTARDCCFSTQ